MGKLGEYRGVVIFHDPEMGASEILAGSEGRKKLPSGTVYSPLEEYKNSIDTEPFREHNDDFSAVSSFGEKVVIKWIVGGPEDMQVYKDAIDLIK